MAATKDYSSIFNINDFIVNTLAPKFFPDMDAVTMATTGTFGLLANLSGTVIEDAFNVTGRYLDESLLIRATLPDFIYAYATSYGVTNIFGTPAVAPMFLIINEQDILNNAKDMGNHKEFRIDSAMKIYVDANDLTYSIPYDIVIRSSEFKGKYAHIAIYDKSYVNSLVPANQSPYIKMIKQKVGTETFIAMRVDAYQYERKVYEEPIITNNKLNLAYIDKTFDGKLANFEAFYEAPNSNTRIQLEKRMLTSPATIDPFIYYKMADDDTIRFSFANDDRYFLPDYNSKIYIYIYETAGTAGNFDWDVEHIQVSPVAETDDESIAYNRQLYLDGQLIGASVGGKDQLTLDEIKALALERQITINSYTTDRDLNLYFLNTLKLQGIAAAFVKYRDDPAGREYGCFTRIDDGTDIIPTNTLDLWLATNQVDERFDNLHQFILKPGARIGYYDETGTDTAKVMQREDPEEDIEYRTMTLMVIELKSNNVRTFMNSIDKDIELSYDYMNEDSMFNFMVGNCHAYRNAIKGDSSYKITLTVARVDGIINDASGVMDETIEMDPSKLKVLMLFETTTGHYIEMSQLSYDPDELMFQYEATIDTNDMITKPSVNETDSTISITNLKVRKTDEVESRNIECVNPKVSFAVFYDYGDGEDQGHKYNEIESVKQHTLCNEYSPTLDSLYFAYPLSLMRCHVLFQPDPLSEDGYGFLIKQVPLVGKDFMDEEGHPALVFNKMLEQHMKLVTLMPQITEAYTINLKFYNTYGRARIFYILDSTGEKHVLNHVHCDIRLKVKFNDGVIEENYIPEIQKFTKKYIESVNNIDEGQNEFHLSVLMQKLHEEYDQIEYILFESINGYESGYQTLGTEIKINEVTEPDVIPEYLSIHVSDVVVTPL